MLSFRRNFDFDFLTSVYSLELIKATFSLNFYSYYFYDLSALPVSKTACVLRKYSSMQSDAVLHQIRSENYWKYLNRSSIRLELYAAVYRQINMETVRNQEQFSAQEAVYG